MKMMHIGDLHLGKSLGDFDLKDDQEYMLDQLLKIVDDQSVDAVLIAGDVYDKAIPSENATRMLDYFLSSLAKRDVHTYVISGNHDSDERLNYGSSLFETNHIFISTKYEGKLYKQIFKKGNEEIDIYLLPFVKASQVRHKKQIEDAEKDAKDLKVIDIDQLKEKCASQKDEVEKKREISNAIKTRLEGNEDKLKKITAQKSELEKSRKENWQPSHWHQL